MTGKAFALLYVALLQLHRYASILFVVACFCAIWVTVTSPVNGGGVAVRHVPRGWSDDLLEPLRPTA